MWRLVMLLLCALAACDGQDTKLKVFLSVDMEGVAGTVTEAQLLPGSFEYERFRGFMTMETLAAIEGAKQAGATDIVVADAQEVGRTFSSRDFRTTCGLSAGSHDTSVWSVDSIPHSTL